MDSGGYFANFLKVQGGLMPIFFSQGGILPFSYFTGG